MTICRQRGERGGDATATIDLAKAFVVTDFDGDFVQLDSGAAVAIENDVPVNNADDAADGRRCLRTV